MCVCARAGVCVQVRVCTGVCTQVCVQVCVCSMSVFLCLYFPATSEVEPDNPCVHIPCFTSCLCICDVSLHLGEKETLYLE